MATPTFASEAEISSFQKYLFHSKSVLALCGAGLSAASGLPTFRGSGGMWRSHKATTLATPEAFAENPGLVWQFYAYRRHMALQATPNPGHRALAALAKKKKNFECLTQNVDGLAQQAGHPFSKLHLLHGSLLDIKCSSKECDYIDRDNTTDPICPVLEIALEPAPTDATGAEATASLFSAMNLPQSPLKKSPTRSKTSGRLSRAIEPASEPAAMISTNDLPHCPNCGSLLRPGVVWFGESLSSEIIDQIEGWLNNTKKIDLMMVIGTTAEVWPAAAYIHKARAKGARIAVINMDSNHLGDTGNLKKGDWMFEGDAGEILPILFEGVLEN